MSSSGLDLRDDALPTYFEIDSTDYRYPYLTNLSCRCFIYICLGREGSNKYKIPIPHMGNK
ncbi:hypothetical protein Aksp01_20080 [Akkermansia sp. NBRC 115031]|nr:hypothetical protein Aksp01_20080 [Akkermansia sp. NBRC 115031]